MTLQEWEADPANARNWAASWNQPHMQAALSILLMTNIPSEQTIPPGVPMNDFLAGEKKRLEGYYEFYRFIIALGRPAALPKRVSEEGWAEPTHPPEKPPGMS